MSDNRSTHTNTKTDSKNSQQEAILLSDIGLSNDLYLSLNYHNVWIDKAGWIAKWQKKQVPLDIDLACVLFNQAGEQIDMVWFKNLRDKAEAICHFGDHLHGYQTQEEKEEHRAELHAEKTKSKKQHPIQHKDIEVQTLLSPIDLEYIHLNLAKLPTEVTEIALIASSFQPASMSQVPVGEIELQDVEGNTAIRIDLPHLEKNCCSLWIASLSRSESFIYKQDTEYQDWLLINKNQPLSHANLQALAKLVKL